MCAAITVWSRAGPPAPRPDDDTNGCVNGFKDGDEGPSSPLSDPPRPGPPPRPHLFHQSPSGPPH
eukprot:gene2912-3497_t